MSLTFASNSKTKFKFQLRMTQKSVSPLKDTLSEHTIPYLPPEIIEHIVSFILLDIPKYTNDDDDGDDIYTKIDDYEYTLLNILVVFPYLRHQIAPRFDYGAIPKHIYNFVFMNIDNVYDTLVMLFENMKAAKYNLDMWLEFITCDHSPFYYTNDGIRFITYILSKYSNHQEKKMKKALLCNLLNHDAILPISKSLDNIIYNTLLHHYKNTNKLKLSLLTSKEKQFLLNYTLTNFSHSPRYNNRDYNVNTFIISIFKLYSTNIIDILVENTNFISIHLLNEDSLIDYILQNYTIDNYVLGNFIKYYLSTVLKYFYINSFHKNSYYESTRAEFTNTYFDIIAPILGKAVTHKHTDLIRLILKLKETTKSNILLIIGFDNLYKNKEHLNLAINYIIHKYYKHTLTFADLSIFDWIYNDRNESNESNESNDSNTINKTLLSKLLLLYKMADDNTNNIHTINKVLLYTIYNYMVFHFNRLNIHLIYNLSYDFKTKSAGSMCSISTYSSSIIDTLELLHIKIDIDTMYKYIIKL